MELGPISKNPRPITNKILDIFLLHEKPKLVDQLKFGYRIQISLNEIFKSSNENCNILFKRFTWWSFWTYLSSPWFLLTQDIRHTEPHLLGVGTNKPTQDHSSSRLPPQSAPGHLHWCHQAWLSRLHKRCAWFFFPSKKNVVDKFLIP